MIYTTKDDLSEVLRDTEFASLAEALQASCLACSGLRSDLAEDKDLPVGASKLGGRPDVPADFVWPECQGIAEASGYVPIQTLGTPLWFVGQIRMQDLVPSSLRRPQEDALLSFFAAVQRDGFPMTDEANDDWRVFCFRSELRRMDPPRLPVRFIEELAVHDEALPRDGWPIFKTAKLSFDLVYSLGDSPEPLAGWDRERRWRLVNFLRSHNQLRLESPLHLAMGFPETMNLDSRTIGARGRFVHPMTHGTKSIPEQVKAERKDDSEWVLLAQFDTDQSIGLYWAGWGRAYFVIRRADLEMGRMENAVLTNDHT